MPVPKYVKPLFISIKNHQELNEKWVQNIIADDPTILGLGDVILKDIERIQPTAGRLDLLLQDAEEKLRYEVEIQLGKTDESHIIRTIEYWDIERKRYPQYEHCAVIVAEDITSRFLNVISLFNGFIPLVAIQMNALKIDDQVALIFTKVLDQMRLGFVEEDEEVSAVADRDYWLKRGTKETVQLADRLLEIVNTFAPDHELKYNKFYIGLAVDGKPNNFVSFIPKKKWTGLFVYIPQADEIDRELEEGGIDFDYDKRSGRYKMTLRRDDVANNDEVLLKIMQMARDK